MFRNSLYGQLFLNRDKCQNKPYNDDLKVILEEGGELYVDPNEDGIGAILVAADDMVHQGPHACIIYRPKNPQAYPPNHLGKRVRDADSLVDTFAHARGGIPVLAVGWLQHCRDQGRVVGPEENWGGWRVVNEDEDEDEASPDRPTQRLPAELFWRRGRSIHFALAGELTSIVRDLEAHGGKVVDIQDEPDFILVDAPPRQLFDDKRWVQRLQNAATTTDTRIVSVLWFTHCMELGDRIPTDKYAIKLPTVGKR